MRILVSIGLLLASLHFSPSAWAEASEDHCLKYHRGTEGADISVFINSCPFPVTVVFWTDGKNLANSDLCVGNKRPMCGDTVPADGQEVAFPFTGTVHFAACKSPSTPASSDGVEFSCSGDPTDIWLNHRNPSVRAALICMKQFPEPKTSDELAAIHHQCNPYPSDASALHAAQYASCVRRFPVPKTKDEAMAIYHQCNPYPSATSAQQAPPPESGQQVRRDNAESH